MYGEVFTLPPPQKKHDLPTCMCWTKLKIMTSPLSCSIRSVNSLCSLLSCSDDNPLLFVSSIWGNLFGYLAEHCTRRLSRAWTCLLRKLLPCWGYTVSSMSSGLHFPFCNLLFCKSFPNIAWKIKNSQIQYSCCTGGQMWVLSLIWHLKC